MVFLVGKEVQEAFGTFSDGPLVSLPAVGSHVMYFPQGRSEQGDNVAPPLTSFEATGFPSELLREVVSSRSLQPKSSSKNVFTVVEFALALQAAGCFSVVLKCVLAPVAAATSALRIPTIGIGAGTFCSGQVN